MTDAAHPSDKLILNLLTPDKKVAEGVVTSVITLTGSEGQIQILPKHVNMIGTLESGLLAYKDGNGNQVKGFVSSGFFEVCKNEVTVTAETFELASQIDAARAKQAEKKAMEELSRSEGGEHFVKYTRKLQRAHIRQRISSQQ